ncbi:Acyl-CoA-binding domain-containing 4 -like protein [Gossypium arboreum]|uniref:Acyl-CoA-binding domain-containing 4-like protein n=1 Tax=Gossypium arboreum TaxID=29729 RepID=A0A0B0MV72_GOSAR|nr:Acyl-CoA-binding domain-containing 4 -like protein [Gossypium arboreum]
MEWSRPTQQGEIPTPRAGHASVTVGENWFIVGGGDNKSGKCLALKSNRSVCIQSEDKNNPGGSVDCMKRKGHWKLLSSTCQPSLGQLWHQLKDVFLLLVRNAAMEIELLHADQQGMVERCK